MLIDYTTQSLSQKYALMSQSIIPRPIAWIVTESVTGVVNIAPFSYFIGLSSEPPTLMVSIGHKSDGTPKDTLKHIRESRKCTICMVDETHLTPMHFSSKPLPEEASEAEYFDIPTQTILDDYPPIVKGIPTAFFCTLHQEIALSGSKTIPLILKVVQHYIDDTCMQEEEGKITLTFKPVARIGKKYAFLGKEIEPPSIP